MPRQTAKTSAGSAATCCLAALDHHAGLLREHLRGRVAAAGHESVRPGRLDLAALEGRDGGAHGGHVVDRVDLREQAARRVVAHDDLAAEALDERPRDGRRDRRHEMDPVRRQHRSEHRHRLQAPAQTARLRVAEHHVAVGAHVGAADLDHAAGALRHVQGLHEVPQQVVHADGLHLRVHPLRADHHRQTLGEVADHLEGDAPGPHDDGGAELGDRHAGLTQRVAGLVARAQMVGDVGLGVAEAAEVDDAADAGVGGGAGEAPRRRDVALVEAAPCRPCCG